jgi:hypothetical protein
MASTIAAITTGVGGVVTTADATGNLSLLSGATTVVAVTSTGVAVTGTLSSSNGISVANTFGFKNRIINGAMVIDQRNAGAAVTANDAFSVDRFKLAQNTDGACSVQQDSSAPAGFINSVKYTTTTADGTLTTTQNTSISQNIEGTNISDLGWGTASASTVTLSFWVRSSLTGTFGGALSNSAVNRSYAFTYSISVADTWEQKSVTIAGDTTGTWLTTNGIGIRVIFGLGVGPDRSGTSGSWAAAAYFSATGATSVIGTLNATLYITGVQLEKGSTATSFDFRAYSTELAMCQRYLPMISAADASNTAQFAVGQASGATNGEFHLRFPVTVRTPPTGLVIDTVANLRCSNAAISGSPTVTSLTFTSGNSDAARFQAAVASGLVAGNATLLIPAGAAKLYFTGCEL